MSVLVESGARKGLKQLRSRKTTCRKVARGRFSLIRGIKNVARNFDRSLLSRDFVFVLLLRVVKSAGFDTLSK
jgi:hypothetical protein